MAYDMDNEVFKLLLNEPFFACLSRHLNKAADKNVKTAGVRIDKDGRFEMVYNPDFMQGLVEAHRAGVLKHELYHLVLEHCSVRSPDGKKISKRWNFATDLSINSHLLNELPEFCLFPKKFNYPEGQTAEWYYAKLEQDGKGGDDGKCNGNHGPAQDGEGGGDPCDCGNFDDHGGWGEGGEVDSEIREVAKERLREAMRQSANEASQKTNTWGTIPQSIQKDIMRFINGSVNWKAVLRAFIGQAQKAESINTVKRINKRYPYIHAGKRSKRHANIAISIDQSGSVSDELLSMFFGELNSLSKLATFTVVPFDCGIDEKKIYVWKKGKRHETERVLNGGTDFDAPTKYVNEHGFDGHIVLTDMMAPAPVPSRCRRMWMTDEDGAANPYFRNNERIIAIKKIR